MFGYRSISIRHGLYIVKPPRIPLLEVPHRALFHLHPEENTNAVTKESLRCLWTWQGGDDKKWTIRGGSSSDTEMGMDVKEQQSAHIGNGPSSYPASYCTAQGHRTYMEDEFFISVDGDFAAVFDGHGGQAISRYLRKNLYASVQAFLPILTTTSTSNTDADWQNETTKRVGPSVEDYENAIKSALDKVDREVQRINHWSYQGSTAVAIWLHEERTPDETDDDSRTPQRTIIAANVGDSRAVLCRNGTAWDLTRDHKPNDPDEKARIESLGGKVVWCGDVDARGEPIYETGIYRLNRNLALSRAIGDRSERPHVTSEAEVVSVPVKDSDEFFLLATDGLWDVMSSQDGVDLVRAFMEAGCDHQNIGKLMVEEALRRGTYDNVTVVIIWLDRQQTRRSR
jgi:serine/threonine protein phosphatase PrpC